MGLAFQVLCNTVSQGICGAMSIYLKARKLCLSRVQEWGIHASAVVDVVDFPAPWIPKIASLLVLVVVSLYNFYIWQHCCV